MSKKIWTLTLAALFFLAISASAADNVVVVPLNSSSQLYVAGTEITSLPYIISTPGSYFVTKNLTCSPGNHGINVNSDNVSINLMGFSLIGSGGGGNYDGIFVNGKSNVDISNGSVINFSRSGISVSSSGTDARIRDVRINNNGLHGIASYSKGGLIDRCSANGNGGNGFISGVGNIVRNCTSTANAGDGFFGSGVGSMIIGNISIENGGDGIRAPIGGIVMNNNVLWNYSGTGISFATEGNVGNVLVDKNTVYQNNVDIDESTCPTCTFGTNQTTISSL